MTRGQNTGHKGKFSVNVYRRLEMGCDGCGRAAEQTAVGGARTSCAHCRTPRPTARFIANATVIYSLGHGLRTFAAVHIRQLSLASLRGR